MPVATPETDAEWARNLPHMTVDQVRSESRRLRGLPPTARVSFEAPADDKVRLLNLITALGHRLGRPVGMADALAYLLGLGEADLAHDPTAERPASARMPARSARIHTGRCVDTGTHQVRGPEGWVALSATAAAMAECDAETVEGGKLTRRIPERTCRLVFERDGMACLVPDCGATHGLNFHHEGPAGWRSVGDDPDHVLLLCGATTRSGTKAG